MANIGVCIGISRCRPPPTRMSPAIGGVPPARRAASWRKRMVSKTVSNRAIFADGVLARVGPPEMRFDAARFDLEKEVAAVGDQRRPFPIGHSGASSRSARRQSRSRPKDRALVEQEDRPIGAILLLIDGVDGLERAAQFDAGLNDRPHRQQAVQAQISAGVRRSSRAQSRSPWTPQDQLGDAHSSSSRRSSRLRMVSRWSLTINVGPPPAPHNSPITFGRPSRLAARTPRQNPFGAACPR